MRYSIEKGSSNKYSVLDSYYDNKLNKPFLYSSFNLLSKPWRRVLGGIDVYIPSQTYESKMSTPKRVATVFFLVLVFPVGFASFTSLLIKFATLPWIWEKKKVRVLSQQSWNIIDQFNKACQNKESDQAVQSYVQRPEIGRRKDVYDNFFRAINWKINAHASWGDIQLGLSLLDTNDAVALINYAIKVKLEHEFKNNCLLVSGDSVTDFIQKSLKYNHWANIESCYEKILKGTLQININDDFILNAFKMDLADHLIRSMTQMRASKAHTELERLTVKSKEILLRYCLFDKKQNYCDFQFMFEDANRMRKIRAAVQNLRQANQIGSQSLKTFKTLPKDCCATQKQWDDIRAAYVEFQACLLGEKEYLKVLRTMLGTMTNFIDHIWKATSTAEIESLTADLASSVSKQAEFLQNLLNLKKTNDTPLSYLRLKKKAVLLEHVKEMKLFLLDNMVPAAMMRFK
ncbi:MAG: hypothetical protein CK425_08580 [Parachlamydia sp.]|nr:MAG: hypothetical protein CK425_08580 [Parachlamydia sp.]